MQQPPSGADPRDDPPADAEDMDGAADTAEERADAQLTLTEEFDRLVNRLVKDKVRAVSAVQDEAQSWRRAIFDRHDEEEQLRMYRELINDRTTIPSDQCGKQNWTLARICERRTARAITARPFTTRGAHGLRVVVSTIPCDARFTTS